MRPMYEMYERVRTYISYAIGKCVVAYEMYESPLGLVHSYATYGSFFGYFVACAQQWKPLGETVYELEKGK